VDVDGFVEADIFRSSSVISPALTFAEHFWHSMPLFRQKLHSSVFIVGCSFPQLGWIRRDVAVVGFIFGGLFLWC
jgi:hypothetical protein